MSDPHTNQSTESSSEHDGLKIRSGLPDSIAGSLFEPGRNEWQSHRNYHGMAQVFLEFHAMLNSSMRTMLENLEKLLDKPSNDNSSDLTKLGYDIHSFYAGINRHHEVEDQIYFPQFKQFFPQIGGGLALMDRDHKVLSALIDELFRYSESILRNPDQAYGFLGGLYDHLRSMSPPLARHLQDEEEIIIPLFLRGG